MCWNFAAIVGVPNTVCGPKEGEWHEVRDGTVDEAEIEENLTGKGPEKLFLGLKLQIAGHKGPIGSGFVRLAVAPGVYLPTALGYDAQAEGEKDISAGDEVNLGV